ncbi:hypothetical protein NU219Hw_g8296t1 [Hortaea werneckii]
MSTASISLPVLTIPLYYILAIYPHGHASVIASKGNPKQLDNRNPKSSTMVESLRKRLSARELAAYERAESCHRNHLENMPLFVAAVLVGLLAEQRAGEGAIGLSAFCTGWMLIRILYTANYIVTETQQWSYDRESGFAPQGASYAAPLPPSIDMPKPKAIVNSSCASKRTGNGKQADEPKL